MARADGRIEQGQSLKSAISARAWNRAQDAADIVLGERTRFAAESKASRTRSLVVPCFVSVQYRNIIPGTVVSLTSATGRYPAAISNPTGDGANGVSMPFMPECLVIQGAQVLPVAYTNRRNVAGARLGVVVGAVNLPAVGRSGLVDVCISGLCVALCVYRTGTGGFMQYPLVRTANDTNQNLAGVGEEADCGDVKILSFSTTKAIDIAGVDIRHATVIV